MDRQTHLWLKKYDIPISQLAQLTWEFTLAARKNPVPPPWFIDMVRARCTGVLRIIFSVQEQTVILPNVVSGFSLIGFKEERNASVQLPPVQLRYFSGTEALEIDRMIQKSLGALVTSQTKETDGVLSLSNEDGDFYIFENNMMDEVLEALGVEKPK